MSASTPSSARKVAIITGASQGIGAALVTWSRRYDGDSVALDARIRPFSTHFCTASTAKPSEIAPWAKTEPPAMSGETQTTFCSATTDPRCTSMKADDFRAKSRLNLNRRHHS